MNESVQQLSKRLAEELEAVQVFEPGIHSGIPEWDYHHSYGVSKSDLDCLHPTPAHYQAYMKRKMTPDKSTHDQVIGTLVHLAALEPERYYAATGDPIPCAVAPDDADLRTKKWQTWRDQQPPGIEVIRQSEADAINAMARVIRSHPVVTPLLERGSTEQCVYGIHTRTGILRRARMDLLSETPTGIPAILDLKTIRDISKFERDMMTYRLHVQDAYYTDLLKDVLIAESVIFRFVAIEKEPPYAIRVMTLDDFAMQEARATYEADLDTLSECESTMDWPAYPQEEVISLPRWAFKKGNDLYLPE